MYKWLRILFACSAAALCAVAIFLGIYLGMLAFLCCAAAAVLFFVMSMFFRYLQQEKEGTSDEPDTPPVYDDVKQNDPSAPDMENSGGNTVDPKNDGSSES